MSTSTTVPSSATPRQPVLGLPDPDERVPTLAWPTLLLYAAGLALFTLQAALILVAGATPWASIPLGAAVTFVMFSVLHEASHHAASTSTPLNDALGHLSVPWLAPYTTFAMIRFIHIEHHRNTNEPKGIDPDSWTSEGPWWQLPFRWATIDVWYLIFYLRRIGTRPRREVAGAVVRLVAFVALCAVAIATGYGAVVLTFLVGQRLGLLVLAWWFDYLPHHGLTATQRENKYRATRIRVGGERWMTPLFLYQNYHLVHHLHPSVPFYRYIRAWRRNEQAYLDRDAAISTWFGRSLTPAEYRTWRRITDRLDAAPGSTRPVFHPLRVAAVDALTDDSRLVTLDVPPDLVAAYRHVAGQHLTLRAVIDGQDVRRSYSIVTPAGAGPLQVAVKHLDGGVFSTYVRDRLVAGDVLDVMTPTGRFHTPLDPTSSREYVGLAAGSGITPLMSVIATTLEVEPASRFTLVLGNRTRASTMFGPELDALVARTGGRLTIRHVLSQTPGAPLSGRITPEVVARLVPLPSAVHAWFVCGPAAMVRTLGDDLAARLPQPRVLTEVFHTEPVAAETGIDIESSVTVTLDGVATSFPLRSAGDTLLDAALQQGLDAPYSCAGGACGTCRAKVLLGRASMDQNHVLDDTEVAAGYVLTCQAHPVSEELAIDYDA